MSNSSPENGIPLQHLEALQSWLDNSAGLLPPAETEAAKQHLISLSEIIHLAKPGQDTPSDGEKQAVTDDSLGILSPETILIEGRCAFDRCRTECQAMVLLALDTDKIHRIAGTQGTPVAEAIMRMVLALVRRKLRKTDIVGRLGDYGLIVILPGCPLSRARVLSEELCQAVEESPEPTSGLKVTISVGVAAPGTATDNLDALLEQGKLALQSAQSNGGNCVIVSR